MAVTEYNQPIHKKEKNKANIALLMVQDVLRNKATTDKRLVYIPEIRFSHGGNRFNYNYKDVWIFTNGKTTWSDIYVVLGIGVGTDTVYRLHADLDHYNVRPSVEPLTDIIDEDKIYRLYGSRLCIPIKGNLLWELDEERFGKLFIAQFTQGNGNDKFRHINYTTPEGDEPWRVGGISKLSKNEGIRPLLGLRDYGISCIPFNEELLKRKNEIASQLELEGVTRFVKMKRMNQYQGVTESMYTEIKDANLLSEYYPEFTKGEVAQALDSVEISKVGVDVVCCGLGSAGSGILEQFARLDYFRKYHLIDFDFVEYKNVINQAYTISDVYTDKATAMGNIMKAVRCPSLGLEKEVTTEKCKFQESLLGLYKGKYIISGFDSTSARIELLEKILNKEYEFKYLIDIRYIDRDASIFFIDLSDKQEVELYKQQLYEDNELITNSEPSENTCTHSNLISVYKIASGYITTAVIELETNERKPFTWVELSCDGMVNARVMV